MPKLIENDFPFAELSLIAERESWRKEVYRPVYYLHKWWARRLGSVFRGILLGSWLGDSEDFWECFYKKNTFENTVVFDPFMGSGVTVGEAVKLGCKAAGRDVNPVAYLACRAALSRYTDAEVLSTYRCLEQTLAPRLLSYFQTRTRIGQPAIVLYYFLVKVVSCPECGKEIDLFKTRIFSKNATPQKDSSARALCPGCGAVNFTVYDAEFVSCPECSLTYNPRHGNVSGAEVRCDGCQHAFRLTDRMKSLEGPLPSRRYAKMILTEDGEKLYEPMNEFDGKIERQIAEEFATISSSFPVVDIKPGYNTNQMLNHNYRHWHELFSDRQLVCIRHLIEVIKGIEDPDLKLLFSCLFSGTLEFNNLFTSFKGEGTGAVRHMFSHHVLKPEMMPLEANIWGTPKSSGAFSGLFRSRVEKALAYKADPSELRLHSSKSMKVRGINQPLSVEITDSFTQFASQPKTAYLTLGDSSCIDIPDKSIDIVVTDPPFFDNVHYSQLADFFYYWLNQALEFSATTTTRCAEEVQDTDPALFTGKLTSVFVECSRVLNDKGLLVFSYHHARHEGWTAVHRAIRHAGLVCTRGYPIKAEMSVSMPLQQAASPIHLDLILVCRKDKKVKRNGRVSYPLRPAVNMAKDQVSKLKSAGIKVSLGDAKVILMGCLLCEAHKMNNLDREERFLEEVEQNLDTYVAQVISAKGEVLYQAEETEQLRLFEEMEKYLASKERGGILTSVARPRSASVG